MDLLRPEDKGTEAKLVAILAAGEDLILCEAVAVRARVASPDAAVIAVIFAIIGKFDQSADKDLVSVNGVCNCPGGYF